jgi:hypothetical protein
MTQVSGKRRFSALWVKKLQLSKPFWSADDAADGNDSRSGPYRHPGPGEGDDERHGCTLLTAVYATAAFSPLPSPFLHDLTFFFEKTFF